ncbi:uncharacterized protein LOC135368336 isoform X2 [Ornithodoros turicata]|uniref:uncharacterized protein LOC135368336 isoform X2 n=1 Tax=Ornithodoros turicata TaxID=34597 RepID=UPI00313A2072
MAAAVMRFPLWMLLLWLAAARGAAAGRCPADQDRWDASNKALSAAFVFQGRLLSKAVDPAGNLLARFRVQKVLKPGFTPGTSPQLWRKQEVVVALVKSRPPPGPRRGSRTGPRTQARRGRSLCPVAPPEGFVFNARYLVYGAPITGRAARRLLPAANFSATAPPDHYTRRSARAIKKVVCQGCVLKPAQAKWLRSTSRVDVYRRLQLRCKLNGNPVPWVQWYFAGKPIVPSSRVHIVTKWRRSRLEINSTRKQDSGLYECRASNVLRREPSIVTVNVTVQDRYSFRPGTRGPTHTSANGQPCPLASYCLNGGTCIYYEAVKEPSCQCADGFIGQRCENKDTASLKTYMMGSHACLTAVVTLGALFGILTCSYVTWTARRCVKRRKIKTSGSRSRSGSSDSASRNPSRVSAMADSTLMGKQCEDSNSTGVVDPRTQESLLRRNNSIIERRRCEEHSCKGPNTEDQEFSNEDEDLEIESLLKAGTQAQHSSAPVRQSRSDPMRDTIFDDRLQFQLCGIVNDIHHAFHPPVPKRTA